MGEALEHLREVERVLNALMDAAQRARDNLTRCHEVLPDALELWARAVDSAAREAGMEGPDVASARLRQRIEVEGEWWLQTNHASIRQHRALCDPAHLPWWGPFAGPFDI